MRRLLSFSASAETCVSPLPVLVDTAQGAHRPFDDVDEICQSAQPRHPQPEMKEVRPGETLAF